MKPMSSQIPKGKLYQSRLRIEHPQLHHDQVGGNADSHPGHHAGRQNDECQQDMASKGESGQHIGGRHAEQQYDERADGRGYEAVREVFGELVAGYHGRVILQIWLEDESGRHSQGIHVGLEGVDQQPQDRPQYDQENNQQAEVKEQRTKYPGHASSFV
jgi:hypothetical protein